MTKITKNSNTGKHHISLSFGLKCLLIFVFLFEINCSAWGLPTLVTTRRLTILIMTFCIVLTGKWSTIRSKSSTSSSFHGVFWLFFFLLWYAGLLLLFIGRGTGEHVFVSILRFFFIGILGTIVFCQFFTDLDELLKCLIVATVIQAVIILLFAAVPTLQSAVDAFVGQTAENADLRRRGYYTGLGCSTSWGTMKMTPAMASCIYYILSKRKHIGKYVLSFFMIALSATAIARTSLILAMIAVLIILFYSGKLAPKKLWRTVGTLLSVFIIVMFVIFAFGLGDFVFSLLSRLVELKEYGVTKWLINGYLGQSVLAKTVIPELSWKTIIGIGISNGISGNGVTIIADGGYMRMYAAIGLPLAIFFYVRIYALLYRPIKVIQNPSFKATMLFMLIYLFVGEFKEYFLTGGYAICIFFAMLMLYTKRESKIVEQQAGLDLLQNSKTLETLDEAE